MARLRHLLQASLNDGSVQAPAEYQSWCNTSLEASFYAIEPIRSSQGSWDAFGRWPIPLASPRHADLRRSMIKLAEPLLLLGVK